jgi:Protein of unknown function (DUF3631)/Toprim domain
MSASTNTLSAQTEERLDTFAVEIAEDLFGPFQEEGEGDWRLASNRSILIHPGATVFNFATQSCSHGVLDMLQREAGMTSADAMKFSRKWLAEHAREGRLAPDDLNEELAEKREREDARRTAEVQATVERRLSHKGTPADLYLANRRLQADDSFVGWIEPTWPGGYGKMITWATDARGEVLAFQSTRLMPDGSKALVKYVRTTHRGPHNWKSRAILRLNCDAGQIDTVHLVEGFEDGLSLFIAGVRNVWVLWGIGRLQRLERDLFPLGLKTIIVVRDDDGDNPDPSAERSLWRGVTHLEGFGKEVKVTPRPRMVTGAPNSMKDVNDLLCHGGVELVQALMKAKPVGKEDLMGADREEIFDQASWMGRDEYDQGREAIAKRLDVRVSTLDEERKARHEKRMAEAAAGREVNPDDELRLDPWEDPVTDLGAVLDVMVDVLARVLAVPATHFYAMGLWAVHTHLLQRRELGLRHSPRLAFQSPLEDTGKTTAMMALLYLVARAMATSSLSGASLFRETDAHHWTILWDEADGTFHKNTNPELEGVFNSGHDRRTARVHRQVPAADGGYETQTFDTFTAIALTMINEFLKKSQQSRCIVLRMKRATQAEAARLEEFDECHEAALLECGRKLVRWAADLDELPTVDRVPGLINRFWLNWKSLLRIAKLAGGEWAARALAAAKADMARVNGEKDDSPDYALLDAIWRVFAADKSNPRRMHTNDLIAQLLQEDEGRWYVANRFGKEINSDYLRERLKKLLPTEADYPELQKLLTDEGDRAALKSRRWRPAGNPKGNPLYGYYELHFADAFERYLGTALRAATAPGPNHRQLPTGHATTRTFSPEGGSRAENTRHGRHEGRNCN